MLNPILSQLHNSNSPVQMLQRFAEFKNSMQGRDPEAMVNELLRSGKMTPQQYEQLKAQAQSFMALLK